MIIVAASAVPAAVHIIHVKVVASAGRLEISPEGNAGIAVGTAMWVAGSSGIADAASSPLGCGISRPGRTAL